jgi:hypothetical protein
MPTDYAHDNPAIPAAARPAGKVLVVDASSALFALFDEWPGDGRQVVDELSWRRRARTRGGRRIAGAAVARMD